jgi:hypothetical protein
MWAGFTLMADAWIQADSTNIEDAHIAIDFVGNGGFKITNSRIINNVTGINVPLDSNCNTHNIFGYVTGTQFGLYKTKFNTDYINQPAHGLIPFAGIAMVDMIFTLGANGTNKNIFHNMNAGIVACQSDIKIYNSTFDNIQQDNFYLHTWRGTAIVSLSGFCGLPGRMEVFPNVSDTLVFNSYRGTYGDNTHFKITSNKIWKVNTGIEAMNNNFAQTHYVADNDIKATRYGIFWNFNKGAALMRAFENNIYVSGSNVDGISINEKGGANGNYIIEYNTVKAANDGSNKGTVNGISASSVLLPLIACNNVELITNHNDPKYTAIRIDACNTATVTNNTVRSHHANNMFYTLGIETNISDNCRITCNNIDSTNYGVYFGGICIKTYFAGNTMNQHQIPLYLNSVAEIDSQPHNGNQWLDVTKIGAVNVNAASIFTLGKSAFVTDPNLGLIYNPIVPLNAALPPYYVNDGGWFFQFPGFTFSCSPQSGCVAQIANPNEGSSELRKAIVYDSTLTSDYIPESKMMAKQSLLYELQRDSVKYASDTALQNFVLANKYNSVGLLSDVKTKLESADKLTDTQLQNVLNIDSINKWYAENIEAINGQLILNKDSLLEVEKLHMLDSINKYTAEKESVLAAKEIAANTILADADTKNDQVAPILDPDANQQMMNKVNIIYESVGLEGILYLYNDILTIAQQCPYKGGKAVYEARIFGALIDNTIVYDDAAICLQQGIYRSSDISTELNLSNEDIEIVPNPANEFVTVQLNEKLDGICKVEIKDAVNKVVYSGQFNCRDAQTKINTTNFNQGIYFVTVHINDVQLNSIKLSIIKK